MSELTTFLKYLFIPTGFLKDLLQSFNELLQPKRMSIIFIIVAVFILLSSPSNKIPAGLFLFLALFIQFRMIYKAGDHNRWKKERMLKNIETKEEEDGTGITGTTGIIEEDK